MKVIGANCSSQPARVDGVLLPRETILLGTDMMQDGSIYTSVSFGTDGKYNEVRQQHEKVTS